MRKKKLQVFVSSTFTDLIEERQAAVQAILSCGHIPAGMELFTAGDESQMDVIKQWIEDSDVYLLILGGRYGSIEPKSGKSYTHLEYEYAVSLKKSLFAVVITEDALDNKVNKDGKVVLELENPQKLKDFRGVVLSKMVKFFDDIKDIELAIYKTMTEFEKRKELIGWIRDNQKQVDVGNLAEKMPQPVRENKDLRHSIKVFISYSRKDKQLRDELDNFLTPLKRIDKIETWHDHQINPGERWDDRIKDELRDADIVLCLISSDFLVSNYIMNEELPIILEREKSGLTKLIPVILRPCPWQDTIISEFQAILGKDKPLTSYDNKDRAFMDIYMGLTKVIGSNSTEKKRNINTDNLAEQMEQLAKENISLRKQLASSNTETYNGLSFDELLKILKDNIISIDILGDDEKEKVQGYMSKFHDKHANLFHFLCVHMDKISIGVKIRLTDYFDKLKGLGLIETYIIKNNTNLSKLGIHDYNCKFTPEGRKFYLKLLSKFHDKL